MSEEAAASEAENDNTASSGSNILARMNKVALLGGIGMLAIIGTAVFGAVSFVESERQREIQQWQIRLGIVADSRAAVRAFYEAAMENGGRDVGAPGLRPEYIPTYYGAFVLDPDGNKIEAVCRKDESA